MKNSHCKCSGR